MSGSAGLCRNAELSLSMCHHLFMSWSPITTGASGGIFVRYSISSRAVIQFLHVGPVLPRPTPIITGTCPVRQCHFAGGCAFARGLNAQMVARNGTRNGGYPAEKRPHFAENPICACPRPMGLAPRLCAASFCALPFCEFYSVFFFFKAETRDKGPSGERPETLAKARKPSFGLSRMAKRRNERNRAISQLDLAHFYRQFRRKKCGRRVSPAPAFG